MKVDYINEVADLSPAIYVPALKEFDTNFNRAISVSDPEIEEEMRKIRSTFLTGLYSYDSAKGVQASIENLLIKYPWNKRVQKFHENNYDKFDVSRTETYKGYKKQLDGKIAEVDTLIADCSKAKKILNWKPKISFDDLGISMVEHDLENVNKL